jgi:hypothetical protein
MSGKIFLVRRLPLIALLAMVGVMASVPLAAEEQPGDGSQEATLNIQLIKTGLFLISGGGANSLLRLSPRRDPRRWKAFWKLRCADVPSENNLKNNGHACPGRNYH